MDQKNLVVITPISLEHSEVLGASQTEIAGNKAAIITSGCTAVLAPQKDASVRSVIGRQCHQVGAGLVDVGSKAFSIKRKHQDLSGQSFELISAMGNLDLQIPMLGGHQATNAAVAAASAQTLARAGAIISDEAIKAGLAKATIAGRLELVPAVHIPGEPMVFVDGAHNHESATALSDALKNLFPERKIIFVIGVNNDKNINAIWRELNSMSKMVITTKSHNLRAMDPQALSDAVSFQATGLAHATTSVIEAMNLALQEAKPDDVICVTGSLYVVAEARDYLLKRSSST
jgi:dihydrofolate synthase/folylpolyglutamate synthase